MKSNNKEYPNSKSEREEELDKLYSENGKLQKKRKDLDREIQAEKRGDQRKHLKDEKQKVQKKTK